MTGASLYDTFAIVPDILTMTAQMANFQERFLKAVGASVSITSEAENQANGMANIRDDFSCLRRFHVDLFETS